MPACGLAAGQSEDEAKAEVVEPVSRQTVVEFIKVMIQPHDVDPRVTASLELKVICSAAAIIQWGSLLMTVCGQAIAIICKLY